MTIEHILNQAHLEQNRTKQLAETQLRAMQETLKEDLQSVQKSTKTNPDKQPDHQSTLQQLVYQPSSKLKEAITKKSYQHMVKKGQVTHQSVSKEVQQALDTFFKPPQAASDNIHISSEYAAAQPTKDAPEMAKRLVQQGSRQGSQFTQKKAEKKQAPTSGMHPVMEDPTTDDNVLLQQKQQTKRTMQRQQANRTSQPLLKQQDIQEYSQHLSAHIFSPNPQSNQKLKRLRQKLSQRGFSSQQVQHMEGKVGQVIQQHMVYDLKQKLIRHHMNKGLSSQLQMESTLEFNAAAQGLEQMKRSGNLPLSIANVLNTLREDSKRDLGNFLYEEAESLFTQHALGQKSIEEYSQDLTKVHQAAAAAGFPVSEQELSQKVHQAIEHLGLAPFQAPSSGSDDQQERPKPKFITKEEALDDTLRYLYMMKALHPSIRKTVSLHFKMKKCRNGMIKLGIYTEEREQSLREQGEFLAARQFMEDLQCLFREEATLPHCTGTVYGVIRKKKAFYLRQLRKIGHGLRAHDIEAIKVAMYRQMYAVLKEQILQLEPLVSVHQHVGYTRKLAHYKKVVARLTAEVPMLDTQDTQSSVTQATFGDIDEAA